MSSTKASPIKLITLGLVIGAIISFGATQLFTPTANMPTASNDVEPQPLYWVAPMDANYQRDKPGKSPMGMDLIPYYASQNGSDNDEGLGTIRVSPDVVNNLGVRIAVAEVKPLNTRINTVGYVSYDEDLLVHIHPRVEGWVEKLYVKAIGDPVEKGQPLYDIYSPELVNAQEELLLALDRNNKRLITASENRLVALQLPKETIKQLKKSRVVQQRITFYAPQQGVVENLKIREGFFVKPGSTLMSIGGLSKVWVEAEVFERQAGQVRPGTPITMTLDYLPGKTWQGKVDYVYPILDAKTRTVKVRLRFDNENGEFKPNMFAQIVIYTSSDESTLLIPKEALIRTGNQDRVVLALGAGRFKSIAVGVGRFDSENVEIISGLIAGEQVVSSAQFLLDSESSKTSDFTRMNHEVNDHNGDSAKTNMANMTDLAKTAEVSIASATVNGTVTSVMFDHRMVTINREAIEKWDRPADIVDFIVAEEVDMSLFQLDAYLMFTFEIHQGTFVIVSAMVMDMPKNMNQKMTKGV